MDDKQAIGGQMLMQMILAAVDKLNAEKGSIDSLNVFPVPDGDTGTNMSLTLNSAGRFIGKLAEEQVSVSEVAKQMAHGALMGARGNSGVILSQILGGFAAALTDKETVDSASLAAGFAGGVESAYKAVAKPMGGDHPDRRQRSQRLSDRTADGRDDAGRMSASLSGGGLPQLGQNAGDTAGAQAGGGSRCRRQRALGHRRRHAFCSLR